MLERFHFKMLLCSGGNRRRCWNRGGRSFLWKSSHSHAVFVLCYLGGFRRHDEKLHREAKRKQGFRARRQLSCKTKHDVDSRVEAVIYRYYQENHDEIFFARTTRDW